MEVPLLTNSSLCRLCSEDSKNSISLFSENENSEAVSTLINHYLPLKVEQEDPFPKIICPGCHIQLEATKLFLDLIISGQEKLRSLHKEQQHLLKQNAKEKRKLEEALQNHNPNASVETYTVQTDENGKKFIIQIYSDGPLFSPDHRLSLKTGGLERARRKRGRPRKEERIREKSQDNHEEIVPERSILNSDDSLPRKRKIRPPSRYYSDNVAQGRELARILKNEGVIDENDEDDLDAGNVKSPLVSSTSTAPVPIGTVICQEGYKEVSDVIFMPKKSRPHNKKFARTRFSCEICHREFQHISSYKVHRNSHNIVYSCQAEGCTVESKDRNDLVKHQVDFKHEGISLTEEITEIGGKVLLTEQEEPLTPDNGSGSDVERIAKPLNCEKCDKRFSCKQNYEVHMKAVHCGERPFVCIVCGKDFSYACSLRSHMTVHAANKIPCDECERTFFHRSGLIYHKDSEHSNKKYVCNTCNKSFKHRQLLLRHQLVHTEERPYKCEKCDKQFKSKLYLISHEMIHKGDRKYACPICNNSFLHKTSFSVHMKLHNGERPFECKFCSKKFSQRGNLTEHERIHTGEKPFICEVCGRSFTTSSQCKLHAKRHTGEKAFGCQICKKQFRHKTSYNIHLRRHYNDKQYKCQFCMKTFIDNWARERHQRVHLGLKKYKCGECHKEFIDGGNFAKHRKIHLKNANKPTTEASTIQLTEAYVNWEKVLPPNNPKEEESEEIMVDTNEIQIHNLLDQDGNTVSLSTSDGQPIPIVSSDNEQLQGLLPDGTLVSFDIISEEVNCQGEQTVELNTNAQAVELLNKEIERLKDGLIDTEQEKPAYLSEDGKVCFITGFDDHSFLALE